MDEWHKKYSEIDDMMDMSDILDGVASDAFLESSVQDAVMSEQATQSGMRTQELQAVIDGWAESLNKSAIAKSTGEVVKTPVAQYKGFAAEEFHKQTMIINARAKGVPSYKFDVYTEGPLPDGTTLTGIDMHSDLVAFGKKWLWQRPTKVADAQIKMHKGPNASKAYAQDMASEQYVEQEFVGGAEQGINDKVHAKIGRKVISSDSQTPDAAEQLAADLKTQSVPEYEHGAEKHQQLNRINLGRAVAAGAITGAVLSTVNELCQIIKEGESLDEEQFIQSVQHVLCGAADGGVRGGAIMGSVQLMGKVVGKEIPANTLGAVPIMAAANVSVDFAKDLYRCFVLQSIDTDDLLCNSINNSFSSVAGFGGAWMGGQITGHILSQGAGAAISAKIAASIGASIGSAIGPIGTVVGSAVGGLLIGLGANAIVKVGSSDAEKAFNECIQEIDDQIELEGCEKLYYFADTMSEIRNFRLSFKDLLPCYNLISDLKEYNLHKKAISHIHSQLDSGFDELNQAKKKALETLEKEHRHRIGELYFWLQEQRSIMHSDYKDAMNTYVANSYIQYAEIHDVLEGDVKALIEILRNDTMVYSNILNYMRNRNAVNDELNQLLKEIMSDAEDSTVLRPFVEKIIWFMQQDELVIGKQYISFDEALHLINEVG